MKELTEWRGFDLSARVEKVHRVFRFEPVLSAGDVPILVNSPAYFSFGSKDKPVDYYSNPASMLDYQARGYERHLQLVRDDYIPYFMPWFGTGVLASAFGAKVLMPEDPADDPAILEPCVTSAEDAARLRLPEPGRSGWMPRVLGAIDYALAEGDLPVGLTDMQGPLDTLGQMCGQAQLYRWMYNEPRMVHEMMDLVTEAFIAWVKLQKEHIGEPLDASNGLQGAYSPCCGVWESDDDLVLIDPGLYREFVVPYVSRIFQAFGNGSVHFCGNGLPHLENLLAIEKLTVVNNSTLGNFDAFARLREGLRRRAVIQIQDASPADPESYYSQLFAGVSDFSGLMLATFVMDNVGMDNQGGYVPVDWDPFQAANRIVDSVRLAVEKRLLGEPVRSEPRQAAGRSPARSDPPADNRRASQSGLNSAPQGYTSNQVQALEAVRSALVDFDEPALQSAVRQGLASGLRPFDIIVDGMAAAMAEVGRLYEEGEFFLPQLVMAGEAMQAGMAVLQPLLQAEDNLGSPSLGKVILGTVKGDLHDIGKNLVKIMLEGACFEVIDLGINVAPEQFVAAAQVHQARLIAMSALLTTTMRGMQQTIEALDAAGLRGQVKVMIGGAPISREYAAQVGADGFAETAVGAISEAKRLLNLD